MYKFLIPQEDAPEYGRGIYLAVSQSRIEEIPLADAYDENGQTWGSYDAGDSICCFSEKTKKFIEENDLKTGDDFAYESDYEEAYDAIIENEDLIEGVDYELQQAMCKAITYWDGSNYRSIILEHEYDQINLHYEVLEDEELEKELNQAIENNSYMGEERGVERYETDKWILMKSRFQSRFENYSIEEK